MTPAALVTRIETMGLEWVATLSTLVLEPVVNRFRGAMPFRRPAKKSEHVATDSSETWLDDWRSRHRVKGRDR